MAAKSPMTVVSTHSPQGDNLGGKVVLRLCFDASSGASCVGNEQGRTVDVLLRSETRPKQVLGFAARWLKQ